MLQPVGFWLTWDSWDVISRELSSCSLVYSIILNDSAWCEVLWCDCEWVLFLSFNCSFQKITMCQSYRYDWLINALLSSDVRSYGNNLLLICKKVVVLNSPQVPQPCPPLLSLSSFFKAGTASTCLDGAWVV